MQIKSDGCSNFSYSQALSILIDVISRAFPTLIYIWYSHVMNPLGLTYCEPIADALIAQPWNTYSNALFFVFAFMLYQRYQLMSTQEQTPLLQTLCLSPILIGMGSTVWHATMIGWTLSIDVASIGVFAALFIIYGMRHILQKTWWMTVGAIVAVVVLGAVTTRLTVDMIPQKSGGFIPLALIILGIGGALTAKKHSSAGYYYAAGFAMLCAALFRVSDEAMCTAIPMGTHWLWHVLTAITAYLMIIPFVKAQQKPD